MANSKHNIQLAFTSDSSQVKKDLDNLKANLTSLTNFSKINLNRSSLTTELIEASNAAAQLKAQLEQATDVNTGKLNLKTFAASLRESNMTLQDYRRILTAVGPEGAAAFNQLTNSILTANATIHNSNTLLAKFTKSFSNVLVWNISSGALNLFTSSIRNAITYTKELNDSLTDIGIVTGKNTDELAKFANIANKTAKELSVSTKKYADASLIYFQQGLSDKEVKERTDLTVKMAAVTGEAASDVSSYMTAIWNNFEWEGKPLEQYINMITALGAATASSSAEIAGGLEKFAPIANTIGLSAEYAMAALATVVSETRQSEETVGTAFKTIFGRFQSLSLGETLDDGTTLTKYSKALSTVGVHIKDSNGNLKDMNVILDELGAKWKTMSRDQQVALANAVAGTRQYTNLIALLDNYDTFQENLNVAALSDGTLTNQFAAYEKSWAGASARMKAAAESFYQELLNDDDMIKFIDFLTEAIEKIELLAKGLGGLPGILSLISSIVIKTFGSKISPILTSTVQAITHPIRTIKNQASPEEEKLRAEAVRESMMTGASAGMTQRVDSVLHDGQQTSGMERIGRLQQELYDVSKNLTEENAKQAALILDRQRALEKEYATLKETYDLQKKKNSEAAVGLSDIYGGIEADKAKVTKQYNAAQRVKDVAETPTTQIDTSDKFASGWALYSDFMDLDKLQNLPSDIQKKITTYMDELSTQVEDFSMITDDDEFSSAMQKYVDAINEIKQDVLTHATEEIKLHGEQLSSMGAAETAIKEGAVFKGQDATTGEVTDPTNIDDALANARENISLKAQEQEQIIAAREELDKYVEANTVLQGSLKKSIQENKAFVAQLKELAKAKGLNPELAKKIEALATSTNLTEKEVEELAAEIKTELNQAAKNADNSLKSMEKDMKKLGAAMDNIDGAQTFYDTAKSIGQVTAQSKTMQGAVEQSAESASASFQKLSMSIKTVGDMITETASAFSSIGFAIQSLKNIGSVWTDDDASLFDKILTTMITMGTVLPALIKSYKSLTGGVHQYMIQKKLEARETIQASKAQAIESGTRTVNMGVVKAHTKSILANTFAALTNPYLIAAALIALAVGAAAYSAVIAANTEEEEKLTQSLKDNTKAKQENLELAQEEMTTLSDLCDEYSRLKDAMDENTSSAEEFYDAYLELKNLLGEDVTTYTKEQLANNQQYRDQVNEEIKEAQAKAAKKEADSAVDATLAKRDEIAHAFSEGSAVDYGLVIESGETDLARDLMNTAAGKAFFTSDDKGRLTVKKNISAEDYAKYFGELEAFLNKQDVDAMDGNETYESLVEIVNNSKEHVSDLQGSIDTTSSSKYSQLKLETKSYKVDSIDKYVDWYTTAKAKAKELFPDLSDEAITSWLDSQIGGDTELSSFKNDTAALEKIAEAAGMSLEDLLQRYSKTSAKEWTALMGVNLDEVKAHGLDTAVKTQYHKNEDAEIEEYLETNKIAKETYEAYIDSLSKENKELATNQSLLKETALYNIALSDGLNTLSEAWDKNVATLLTAKEGTWEYLKAVEAVLPAVEKAFGVDLSYDWFANPDNVQMIQELLSGNTSVAPRLILSMGNDTIDNDVNLTDDQKNILKAYFANPENSEYKTAVEDYLTHDVISDDQFASYAKAYGKSISTQGNNNRQIIASVSDIDTSASLQFLSENVAQKEIDSLVKYEQHLDSLERDLDKVSAAKERAFGKQRKDAIAQEKEAMSEYLDYLDNEYLPAIEQEVNNSKTKLETFGNNLHTKIQVQYDEYGNIINRDELIKAGGESLVKEYEANLKTMIEKSDIKETMEEELSNLILEDIELSIEYKVQVSDEQMSNLDYRLEKYSDNMQEIGETMTLLGTKTKVLQDRVYSSMDNITSMLKGYDLAEIMNMESTELSDLGFTPDEIELIRSEIDKLRSDMQALDAVRDDIGEQLTKYIDYMIDELGSSADKIEELSDFIANYSDIIDSVGSKILGVSNYMIRELNKANQTISTDALKAAKTQYDTLLQVKQEAQAELEKAELNGASEETKQYWREAVKTATDSADQAKSQFLESWQNTLETAASIFSDEVSMIVQEMDAALSGTFGNLSYLQNAYEQKKTLSEQYLSEDDKKYQLSKLSRTINRSMDSTQSLRGKQMLKELEEEINALQEQNVEINEYDLQILQKQYEVRQAQIALEEAQNAKTQVRLQRTADGGLSYIYTANQNNLDQAQQNYEDKMHELQKINTDYIDSVSNDLFSLWSDFMSKMQELAEDSSITPEQRLERSKELLEYMVERAGYLGDSFNSILQNSGLSFSETLLGQLMPGYDSFEEFYNNLVSSATKATQDFSNVLGNYQASVDTANSIVGIKDGATFDTYLSQEISGVDGLIERSSKTVNKAQRLAIELTNTYTDMTHKLSNFYLEFDKMVLSMANGVDTSISAFQKLLSSVTGVSMSATYEFVKDGVPIDPSEYDTGGYTGAWGSEGKLAVLHEKELVLNADDTANILEALSITHAIDNLLNMNAVKDFGANLQDLSMHSYQHDVLEQNVQIHADFPNVTERSEIEDAFDNILNMAAQYALRK